MLPNRQSGKRRSTATPTERDVPTLRHPLNTLEGFLCREFFRPFTICLAAFTLMYVFGDAFDHMKTLINYGGLGTLGIRYLVFKVPLMVSQVLPAAALAGVLLCFAFLNRKGELLACQQLGMSRLQIAAPFLLLGGLLSVFDFVLSETIVPRATRRSSYLYRVEIKKRTVAGVFADHIWVRVPDGFLFADSYGPRRQELRGVIVYRVSPDAGLREILQAQSASWDGHAWAAKAATTIRVSENGASSGVAASSERRHFGQNVSPNDLSLLQLEPEEFSLWELNRYLRRLRQIGLDPGGYLVDRDLKFALPLACLIMVALGMALSLDPLPRNSRLSGSISLAIAIGALYWVVLGLTSSLGRTGLMPAWIAAWLANFIFATVAVAIFMIGEER